jgi:sugar O-acyltransferase (sialic acid O-acetyltransferase NeuD family)
MVLGPHKSVILVGGGGHARVLIASLRRLGATIVGCVVADPQCEIVPGVPVLGNDDALDELDRDAMLLVNGIGSLRPGSRRVETFERLSARGWTFASVIDPTATVAEDCSVGEGLQIMAGSVVQPGVRIGRGVVINTRVGVDHDCRLDDHVHLAPGVTLSGGVTVGAEAHLGTGAVVIEGRRIGSGALVAAGSVVVRDVLSGTMVMGVPARVKP